MEDEKKLIRGIRTGLLAWADFPPRGRWLYIGKETDALAGLLRRRVAEVVCATPEASGEAAFVRENAARFDGIVSVAALERTLCPAEALRSWRRMLAPRGTMWLGMNNRFGLRYFCGDRDLYTERSFDGVEAYRGAYGRGLDAFCGRMYSREEIRRMLAESGWTSVRFYSVLSDLENPVLLYAEDALPNEDMANRLFPTYHAPETVFLEEESICASLAENGLFHLLANAYLVECAPSGQFADMLHVTSSMERGEENAFLTVIRRSGTVEKRAAYPAGRTGLRRLAAHMEALRARGIPVVEGKLADDRYIMPRVEAETGQLYLKRLLTADREMFLREMDRFRDMILRSSELVSEDRGDGAGAVLREGYWDMVPLNSFYLDGRFVLFDQEFRMASCPANLIVLRMLGSFYSGNAGFRQYMPVEALFERYRLTDRLEEWQRMDRELMAKLRREETLLSYHACTRRDAKTVYANRQRMNFSAEAYQRLFVDIFEYADTRKLILFGSGRFARRFFALYGMDYPVYAVVDNDASRWGARLEGVEIVSPEIFSRLRSGEYKVMICIKDYLSVMRQLEALGVRAYSVYDPGRAYPRKRRPVPRPADSVKKYHIGYIAGVFDLFHVGHQRLFRRAKERCDYLIVGVVSDEGVRRFKRTEPFVPFAERIEMVRGCRYVDEAAEIPLYFGGTQDAWRMHHFDVQFSGSDYVDNPYWLREKAFLEAHGAAMEFFPYTEETSSTKLKALIAKKLM